jgi:orotidine-5'-phosphate decarboxylase
MTGLLLAVAGRTAEEAVRSAKASGEVAGFVVGIELLSGPGPAIVSAMAGVGPVMVMAGLHGGSTSAAAAARRLADYGAHWVTVQAKDGPDLVAAVGAAGVEAVAVTLRPGQTDAEVASLRLGQSRGKTVSRLAEMAVAAGATGILCDFPDLGVVAQVAPAADRFVWVTGAADAIGAVERGATHLICDATTLSAVRAAVIDPR